MAEENTAVAEPAVRADVAGPSGLSTFGNIEQAFDKVFPSTKSDAPHVDEPIVPAPKAAPPEPEFPEPTGAARSEDLPPDAAFGDKPPEPAPPKKEFDAPDKIRKDPKQYENWNQVRGELEAANAKVAKFEAEMPELVKKANTPATDETSVARIAELESVNKELSERISSVDLQSHPEFQRRFVQARDGMVDVAARIVKDAGGDADGLKRAMDLHGTAKIEALDEIVEGIRSPTLRGQLNSLVGQINDLDRQRTMALANSKGNIESLRQQDAAMRHQQAQQTERRIVDTIEGMAKHLANEKKMAYFRPIEGNEKWNEALKSDAEMVRDIMLKTTDESQFVAAVMLGVKAPRMYSALVQTRAQLKTAEKELAEFRDSAPGFKSRYRSETSEGATEPGLTFAEAVARNSPLS